MYFESDINSGRPESHNYINVDKYFDKLSPNNSGRDFECLFVSVVVL